MKILFLFCDMVRPGVLDFNNSKNKSFEGLLKSMGGTYYSNCFSHGPDTGRSMGCYWSGFTPPDNGCDTRAKYPKFYLNKTSFLDILTELKYDLYFFTNPNEKVLGCLPPKYDEIGKHNIDLDLDKFVESIDLSKDNIFAHIALTDFHWALDDYGANEIGVANGLRILYESISNIFKIIPSDVFDYIFVFSDHGFKFQKEYDTEDKIYMLNRDRSNVLMFIHEKGKNHFGYNDKLCSLVDVYPTIMGMINHPYNGYGNSLFSDKEPAYIIADEHGSFLPEASQKIEYWALIKKDVIYLRSYYEYCRDDGKPFDLSKDEFDETLCKLSTSFRETYKQLKILDLYRVMATDKSFYTNGEPRFIIEKNDYIGRLKRKINKLKWKYLNKKI